jgi:threonine dehydrogenase-like Zn-dependent dehydrogenase
MPQRMTQAGLSLVENDQAEGDSQLVALLEEPYAIRLARARIPEPEPDEVRVKIKWVGICGSDVEAYRGVRAPEFLSMPARLGHEVAGTIDRVGDRVIGLAKGQRVVLRYVWGAFAEYVTCRPFSVMPVPACISLQEASLIEILPGVLHAAELGAIDPSKDVLITGQGVSGLILTQVVHLFSPKTLVVTDLFDEKLALSRKYGATHTYRIPSPTTPTMDVVRDDFPRGFDVVIPCLLEGDGMIDAIDAAAQNGRVVMYGCVGPTTGPVDFYRVHRKRLDIFSTEPKRDIDMRRYFEESISLVAEGLVNTHELITHTFPLQQIGAAFALREEHRRDVIHVMIDCAVE